MLSLIIVSDRSQRISGPAPPTRATAAASRFRPCAFLAPCRGSPADCGRAAQSRPSRFARHSASAAAGPQERRVRAPQVEQAPQFVAERAELVALPHRLWAGAALRRPVGLRLAGPRRRGLRGGPARPNLMIA